MFAVMVTQSYSTIKPLRFQESEVIAVDMAIKALREAKGYSPGELAQILGVEVGQLYTQHTS